ncbi:MAG: helix-turn-helix domain-containing protein [Bacilli bacterium]|nr:helix-turn-helix domain-containing protein [Bacilli bacterium]
MNQIKIGKYIQLKRKEKNITQEQLAERLGVSNKTISKWECGKVFPDYSLVESLCEMIEISTSELFNGEDNGLEEKATIEMLERIQKLENQKNTILGIMLIILGIACICLAHFFNGSHIQDFISGVLLGLAIGEMLIGVFITVRFISK